MQLFMSQVRDNYVIIVINSHLLEISNVGKFRILME